MVRAVPIFVALVLLAGAAPAAAQFGKVKAVPDTWMSVWIGGFHDPGNVSDDESNSRWDFGPALGGGAGLHHKLGSSLMAGLDVSFAPARYERTVRGDTAAIEESGRLATAMLSGRLRYGGGGDFSMYLTGGAGAFIYGLPALDRWDPDLALLAGAGLEYRAAPNKALFLEWGKYWTFHQHDGVQSNSPKHSALRVGGRFGW
ncbi:MAG: outer membrane beta-barrel protein [Gemmatimonadetes bacterium]|nr:outer membrane beta-barrel protein [Gemmatimonadota bacterium]